MSWFLLGMIVGIVVGGGGVLVIDRFDILSLLRKG